jgi:energy-coupling factor transport system ATP-binding protein
MSAPLVAMENVSYRYPSEDGDALTGIDLVLRAGEVVALIGPNGAGKSTLARHLNGLLRPTVGRVLVDGVDTRTVPVARLAASIGYAFQNPDHQLFAPTVAEDVGFGPRQLGYPAEEIRARVTAAMAALGIEPLAGRHPLLLGRGQRRLVALAGVLALRPSLLVLDEPTAGLDIAAADRVRRLVDGHRRAGGTAVLISHDLDLVAADASRVVMLRRGRVVADGAPRRLLSDGDLLSGAGLAAPTATRLGQGLAGHGLPSDLLTGDEFVAAYVARFRATTAGRP